MDCCNEENETIIVVVPHDQLSLAIGKKGQNARLASKLVGWNIDIRGDGEPEEKKSDEVEPVGAEVDEESSDAPKAEPEVAGAAADLSPSSIESTVAEPGEGASE